MEQNKRLLPLHASLRLESSLSCFSQLFQNRLPPSITAVVNPISLLSTSYDSARKTDSQVYNTIHHTHQHYMKAAIQTWY